MHLLAQSVPQLPQTAAEGWIVCQSLWMCVSVLLEDRLFQTQLAAPRHDGHLVFHVEAHQVADTQKDLITGPHLGTQKHQTGSHVAFLFYPCTLLWKQTPPPALPVHAHQPAAGDAQCLPPSHWGRTDQRQSCSLWPGNPRCRWGGTPPAHVPTWDERCKVIKENGDSQKADWCSTGGSGTGMLMTHLPWNQPSSWIMFWIRVSDRTELCSALSTDCTESGEDATKWTGFKPLYHDLNLQTWH